MNLYKYTLQKSSYLLPYKYLISLALPNKQVYNTILVRHNCLASKISSDVCSYQ